MHRFLLFVLTAATFAARLARLLESPHPLGTDGYYYVVQVERFLSTGRFHAPDGSWVLYALAGVAAPFRDPILGVKVGESLLAALCVPAGFLAGRAVVRAVRAGAPGETHAIAGWTLALWAAASPTLGQLAAEFPKNLGMAAPGLLALGLALGERSKVRMALAAAAALACASAHRTGAAVALLALAGAGLGYALRRVGATRRATFGWLLLGAGGCAAFALLSALLPNLLHPSDLERLSGQLRPALGWPPPLVYFTLRRPPPLQAIELMLSWPALGLGALAWIRRPASRPVSTALLLPLLVALSPIWRADVLDVGYRLGLLSPLLGVPLSLAAISAWRRTPDAHRLEGDTPSAPRGSPSTPRAQAPLLSLLIVAAALTARTGIDPRSTPPYDRFRRVVDAIPRPLPELVIAHQGLSFFYDHVTGGDAMAWAPEPALDRTHVGRIAWGIRPGEWLEWGGAPGAPAPVKLDRDYFFVREDVWEALVARARASEDDDALSRIADWRNPSAIRPRYLSRNQGR